MDALQKMADSLGMPMKSLINYTMYTCIAFVMFGVGQTYITNIIGVAYPAFQSFRALESSGMDDDK